MGEATTKLGEVSEAVQAFRLGQLSAAREMLALIQATDPTNEYALLWQAAVAESPEEALSYLERVVELHPHNELAFRLLSVERLRGGQPGFRKPAPPDTRRPITELDEPETGSLTESAPPEMPPETCPVCETLRPDDGSPSCQECGIPWNWASFEIGNNLGAANDRRLESEIRRWQKRVDKEGTVEALTALGLAHLALQRSGEAYSYLKRALTLTSRPAPLRKLTDALERRPLVLVVDDSATVRRLVSLTLERNGHRVRTAVDGRDGLARFEEETPRLVLLDINMPEMDGYELCKTLRRSPAARNLPILMLSGKDGLFDKVRGKMAGASDYLTKPFEQKFLLQTLSKFLQPGAPAALERK